MALPEYALISRDLWLDPTFVSLPIQSQHLYLTLLTQPAVQDTGIIRWDVDALASLARGLTADIVAAAAEDLRVAGLLMPNEGTGTVMVLDPIEGCNVSLIGRDTDGR